MLKKYEDAISSFTSSLKLGMVTHDLYNFMAQSLENTGDKKTAEIFFEKALKLK